MNIERERKADRERRREIDTRRDDEKSQSC